MNKEELKMTEQEAILVLKDFDKQVSAKADGAYQTTIGKMACDIAIFALEEIQQYRALGTVEELQEAMEKQVPKKPQKVLSPYGIIYECRECGNELFINPCNDIGQEYCHWCGQRLDWRKK